MKNNLHPFIIESGLKSQKEFEKKFKTEEDFFSKYPHMRPKAAMGYTLNGNDQQVDEFGNPINPNVIQLNAQPSQAWQTQNPNSQQIMGQVYQGNQTQPVQQQFQPITNQSMLGQGQPMQLNTNQYSQNIKQAGTFNSGALLGNWGMQGKDAVSSNEGENKGVQGMNGVGTALMGVAKGAGQFINGAINAAPSLITAITPEFHNQRNKPLPLGYMQNPYGTGSNTMYAMGGSLNGNPIEDVMVEDNAIKAISPSFSQITGRSHSEGGQDVAYGGNIVEMQNSEPIAKTADGSVVAFGKMKNPLTEKLFESDAKQMAKEENKISKIASKAEDYLQSDTSLPHQAITFNTGQVLSDAARIKQKQVDTQKEIYSELQDNILQIANEQNMKPKTLANKIKFAKDGVKLPKFASGGKMKYKIVTRNEGGIEITEQVPIWDEPVQTQPTQTYSQPFPAPNNQQSISYEKLNYGNQQMFSPVFSGDWSNNDRENAFIDGTIPSNYQGIPTTTQGQWQDLWNGVNQFSNSNDWVPSNGQKVPRTIVDITSNMGNNAKRNQIPYLAQGGKMRKREEPLAQLLPVESQPLQNQYPQQQIIPIDTFYQAPTTARITPYTEKISTTRPSLADNNRLGLASIIPEIATALDRPDYVQGQGFTPELMSPYRVSFQDQINQNQSTFSQIQRTLRDNPAALSTLASNVYDANNRVQAEEFRTNQDIANQTYNTNTSILNDAEKTNISLRDLQADRQIQAKANTDNNRNTALNSISAKFQQNKAENNKIRLMENMSGYRTDANGKLVNYNDAPNFNFNGAGETATGLDRKDFASEEKYQSALIAQQRLQLQQERLAMEKKRQAQKTTSVFSRRRR